MLVTMNAIEVFPREAFLPAPDTGLRLGCVLIDLVRAQSVGGGQDKLGAPDVFV